MNVKKKVLIVDDSLAFAMFLKNVIDRTDDLETVGVARDGYEAIKLFMELKPDVITMDIIMPEMDGLEAAAKIMALKPTPIVIISSHLNNKEINATFRALEAGALTIVNKPNDIPKDKNHYLFDYVLETIRTVAKVNLHAVKQEQPIPHSHSLPMKKTTKYKVIALGASTGGPSVLKFIFSALPENFPLPIVVVQHIASGFISGFIEWLGSCTKLKVKVAKEGEELKPAHIYFPPDGRHLTVLAKNNKIYIKLQDTPPVNGFKPSITVLFESLAKSCPEGTIAGLLTGIGEDGVHGLKELYLKQAKTFAQDRESSVIFSMPGGAQKIGAVRDMVSMTSIPNYLLKVLL